MFQIQKAADKVQEMVEEKSRLAKKLEKALSRAHEHAENYDEEMQSRESKFKRKIDDLNRYENLAPAILGFNCIINFELFFSQEN